MKIKIKNKKTIIVVIILLIILSIMLVNNNKNKQKKSMQQETGNHISSYYSNKNDNNGEIVAVTDKSDFFTVQACINQYINYLNIKDTEKILKLLDKSYINKFKITQDNILNYVEDITGGDLSIKCRKMYFQKIDNNIYKYYATGDIIENDSDGVQIRNKMNITVITDLNNMSFSVIPYGYGGMLYEEN